MKFNYKKTAVGMIISVAAGVIIEGELRSPAKIEPHVEVQPVNEAPYLPFIAQIVAGTTASGDSYISNEYIA